MIDVSSLNSNQIKAVKSEGTIIVIAGPGTGKTKTLISRIFYLIQEKNVSPQEILALTFTQKAAGEMKERLANLKVLPYISTFHALAFDILKNTGESIELIPERDRTELLQTIQGKDGDKKTTKREIKDLSLLITQFKNNLYPTEIPAIVSEYNRLLDERGFIDFDDLLLKLYELLHNNNQKVSQNKKRFLHILIDEFQDTNNLQYQIVKLLLKNKNLFVIGDPDQSIYSFRGAQGKLLQILKQDFPENQLISLDTSYRSFKEIITASSALFPQNISLKPITNGKGEVALVKTINEYTEGEYIAAMINKKIGGTDLIAAGTIQEEKREIRFSDFAVIYRTHAIGRTIEQKLVDSGIPYQVVGGLTIYERPEVAFITNLLQYISSKDSTYFKDLLYSSVLQLSPGSKQKISWLFNTDREKAVDILDHSKDQYLNSQKDIHMISTMISLMKNISREVQSKKLMSVIHIIIEHPLVKGYVAKNENKENNIHAFISTITQFDNEKKSLEKCVQYLSFLKEHEFYDPSCDKVTLLTLHASKGLEFKYVFICGFEDGIIPFDAKNIDTEEEKRLLYVGMTRAKEGLYLLTTKLRNKKESIISRFYPEISKRMIVIEDEVIMRRAKQIKKWKEKKNQLQLF